MTEKKIVVIDSQRLDSMQTCGFLYHTKFHQHLVPLTVPIYLERGGLIHEMLGQYYKMKKYRSRWSQNRKTHQDVVQSCITAGRFAANKLQMDIAEVEETIHVFLQYTSHWENDGWDNIIATECAGSKILFDSQELTILYEVKIDLVIRLNNGTIVPIDHKHSGSRRDPNFLSNQFKGYCWFLGVNNLIQNEIGFQKTVKPVDKFRRHTVSFSDNILEEWKENTIFWIVQQLHLDEIGLTPRNYTSCDKYSGCELKHICTSDPGEMRDYRIKSSLKERVWDVGAKK